MDTATTAALLNLGVSLTELAVKGTASAVAAKIKSLSNEKNLEKVKSTYEEIINELVLERENAVRIAQAYKSELDKIEISDENIQHLHNTVGRVLDIFKTMSPGTDIEMFEQMKILVNVDTLKAMQLLGFNYKAAIGEPLTQLCADAISSKQPSNEVQHGKKKR